MPPADSEEELSSTAISVVLPAYNESGRISEMISRTDDVLAAHFDEYEMILVDDGSEDQTLAVAQRLESDYPSLTVVAHDTNQGKGAALTTGVRRAAHGLVLLLDADLDIDPAAIPDFVARLREAGADVVIGSKSHTDSEVDYPAWRRFLSWGYSRLIQILFSLDISDPQAGMKLFRREVLDDVLDSVSAAGYGFDIDLLTIVSRRGYTIVEAPVTIQYGGDSELSPQFLLKMVLSTLRTFRKQGDEENRRTE